MLKGAFPPFGPDGLKNGKEWFQLNSTWACYSMAHIQTILGLELSDPFYTSSFSF